ncbi:MAG: AAA domain-containing protein [Candidatus Pacebacteria bacterium]|nr:AAA domain-containing protein [Candidatus Paceibacterota bacterium]MDD4999301.1 AAA domain-containing protein [Candidatus Paceibacterota bacterium]
MPSRVKEKTENKNGLAFIKEVAKYFMDFLETDFHKRRNPKRSIKFRNENNLLVGLNLNKYPAFNKIVWKSINHAFDKNVLSKIEKGVYKANIPNNLLDLIKIQVKKISEKKVNKVIKDISKEIEQSAFLHKKEYDKAMTTALEGASKIIQDNLVLPFIHDIEKPLENLNLGDENIIYLMEEELTGVLVKLLENKASEIIKFLIAKEKVNISKELDSVFNTADIKNNIIDFFDNFKVADLFAELFEMDRNRNILDKQEFYLYFCDITFDRAKYPIFYIPFNVEKQGDILNVNFDSQVYINKKALEYIVQEYNKAKEKKGHLKTISERIIYLAQHKNDFREVLGSIINEIVNFFELDSDIDINNPDPQTAKSFLIRISNTCYIGLFDKSDEALVNDYEEILQLLSEEDSIIAGAFNNLIEDFIHKNPEPFNEEVEDEWDDMNTGDKLVFASPIPLNSEQRQILEAVRKDGCKYITVEGPPGTGKSHTITAIVFDTILKNQSTLVLSDKKEALDVVEEKITDTMNRVRFDKKFQNPILRLGKTGNTYSQILSTASIENIKTNYRAVKKDYPKLEKNIDKTINSLKEDLEAEILAYGNINIEEIYELFKLEDYYKEKGCVVDIDEVLKQPESAIELEEFRKILTNLKSKLAEYKGGRIVENKLLRLFEFSVDTFSDLSSFQKFLYLLTTLSKQIQRLRDTYKKEIDILNAFKEFSDKDLFELSKFIKEYEDLKNFIFGYFLKGKKLKELDLKFKKAFPFSDFEQPHQELSQLKKIVEIFNFSLELKNQLPKDFVSKIDYIKIIHRFIFDTKIQDLIKEMVELGEDVKYLAENLEKYPKTSKKVNLSLLSFKTLCGNQLTEIPPLEFNKLIRYINLKQKVIKDFQNVPLLNYANQKKNIEDLVTTQMTYLLDKRVIDFYEKSRATARALRDIIRSKRRFPKDEFIKLKESFPCILAGIRDYAEYIPLEPEIFDLVIIDEASQVSIAQAFPALLRAKKIVILGDKKQFSNIKAAQARSDTNREYINGLESNFRRNVSQEQTELVKLEKFNIKTSILEFFEFIRNFNTQLSKHFRGYKEIISYSDKYFYQDSLQVMKIRGKPIDEVLKFTFIKHDGKQEVIQNANVPEIEFIISELKKLKEKDSNLSVGIITPHTNQQKLAMEMISKLPERDYFFEKLKLKIMTFDTCQGEERDIIFYSMVATEELDRLWGVFIKDLGAVDIEEDGRIKAQRLNVGFSRAKECIHFVLSKPLDEYTGSIGEALRHYSYTLEEAKKEKNVAEVDQKSKMEPEVMNWFYQTQFWKNNKDNIEFRPQFELGKYLRQLDKTYNHPDYVVDFLLVYQDETNEEHKIIIEYDGFQEHFREIDEVNEFNYHYYYSDEDVYRQKVLESYGYKFLRINRFNVGENPIKMLDERIANLVKDTPSGSKLLTSIQETIEGLQNGEMKECPKCKKIRRLEEFKDDSLITGYGRFCTYCKGYSPVIVSKTKKETQKAEVSGEIKCPSCGSNMVLRHGRYGEFYGCSKFPYCRGTRPYK